MSEVAVAALGLFGDGQFDAAVSVFGVIFARPAETAATEIARVVRPGGPGGDHHLAPARAGVHRGVAGARGDRTVAPTRRPPPVN